MDLRTSEALPVLVDPRTSVAVLEEVPVLVVAAASVHPASVHPAPGVAVVSEGAVASSEIVYAHSRHDCRECVPRKITLGIADENRTLPKVTYETY